MGITISGVGAIEKAVRARLTRMTPVFKEAVETEKERIISRTQSGVDINGGWFKPYSARWEKVRASYQLRVDRVDLTFSGDMFRALKVSFSRDTRTITATLSFGDESRKAIENEAMGRPFFGFSDEQVRIIKNKLRQVI
jgi:hypothetical protein